MKFVMTLTVALGLAGGSVMATPAPAPAIRGAIVATADSSGEIPGARPMGDADNADDEWRCTCTGTCDGHTHSVHPRICVDDDRHQEAIDDAVTACAHELEGRCEQAAHCACQCRITGRNCPPDPPR